jgi:hypothetical protein
VGKTRRDKWRNNTIRETLDQELILNYIERRSIKWYDHVVRMQDYRKPKWAMEARGEKRRSRGRPRRTWENCVIDAARRKGKALADLRRLARDRTAFRQLTEDKNISVDSQIGHKHKYITRTSSTKFLDLITDDALTWKHHIDYITG